MLDELEVMRCMLLRMLDAVEGVLCLLDVLDVQEVREMQLSSSEYFRRADGLAGDGRVVVAHRER